MSYANSGNQSMPLNVAMPCLTCKPPDCCQAEVKGVSLASKIDATGSLNGADRQSEGDNKSSAQNLSHAVAERHACVLFFVLVCPNLTDAGFHYIQQE